MVGDGSVLFQRDPEWPCMVVGRQSSLRQQLEERFQEMQGLRARTPVLKANFFFSVFSVFNAASPE